MISIRRKLLLGVVASFVLFCSYIFPDTYSPGERAKQQFIPAQHALDSSVAALLELSKSQAGNPSAISGLRSSYLQCRKDFKKIEYLSEYYAPYLHINRPFLPEIDERDREIEPPVGFGVIENILFTQDTLTSLEELKKELYLLHLNVKSLKEISHMPQLLDDRHLFEAMHAEIIRIGTLGITGYDTPEALTCVSESAIAMKSLQMCMQGYYPQLPASLRIQLESSFSGAIHDLEQHADFVSFDRLNFIRAYANPISMYITEAQKALNIPVYASKTHLLDYDSPHIFSPRAWSKYTHISDRNVGALVALGKMLFFDPVLSGNGKRSCASCHQPKKAFTDGSAKSIAFNFQGTVGRNAPTLLNACLQPTFFHDGRARSLEQQAGNVIENPNELGGNFIAICKELKQSKEYIRLFKKAFGPSDTLITAYQIRKAIAAFEKSMIALNSPFDRYLAGDSTQLSTQQILGCNLFMGKAQCATCHFAPLFSGLLPPDYRKMEVEVLGTTTDNNFLVPHLDDDKGRAVVTKIPLQEGAFKTPSIRNVSLTAPYMHNGALKNLEEVMEFYNKGGGKGLGLDVSNQTLPEKPLHLSKEEISALISFMESLSDTSNAIKAPSHLPKIRGFDRKVGGEY
jgi:cytochrome c peroxidase